MTGFPLPGRTQAVVAVPAPGTGGGWWGRVVQRGAARCRVSRPHRRFHLDVRTRSPAWTDFNRSDPGVALLELFAYLADAIASYQDAIAAEQRLRRRRYALAVGTLALALFVWWRGSDGTDEE
jgi:hypothetical protein